MKNIYRWSRRPSELGESEFLCKSLNGELVSQYALFWHGVFSGGLFRSLFSNGGDTGSSPRGSEGKTGQTGSTFPELALISSRSAEELKGDLV
jgi:hypothetical protein